MTTGRIIGWRSPPGSSAAGGWSSWAAPRRGERLTLASGDTPLTGGPYYDQPEDFYFADMLSGSAIYKAMRNALDSKPGVVRGLAFAQPEGGGKNDLGFAFRVYRGEDTVGWYTALGGNESYTLLNVYVDITPVRLATPLYKPLTR